MRGVPNSEKTYAVLREINPAHLFVVTALEQRDCIGPPGYDPGLNR